MQEDKGEKGRGDQAFSASRPVQNLIMAWGSEPSKQVRLDTKMVSLFFETLKRQFDSKTLSVTFPKMIESLIELGSD